MLFQIFVSIFSSMGFCMIFNAPKNQLLYCGLCGLISYSFYSLGIYFGGSSVFSSFIGAIGSMLIARILSYKNLKPVTIYLISGILNLVPGLGIYKAMFQILQGKTTEGIVFAIEAVEIAGAIAIGILVVSMIPERIFIKMTKSK